MDAHVNEINALMNLLREQLGAQLRDYRDLGQVLGRTTYAVLWKKPVGDDVNWGVAICTVDTSSITAVPNAKLADDSHRTVMTEEVATQFFKEIRS